MTYFGAPGGTRTPDLLVRSQSLYPAELRAHIFATISLTIISCNEQNVNDIMRIFHVSFTNS